MQVLTLGDLTVDVLRKDIKNLHLSVHPPTGRVRIAAPLGLDVDAIRAFAVSRIAWIRKNQRKLVAQPREPEREYIDRESHFIWGERALLRLHHGNGPPLVRRAHRVIHLTVRVDTTRDERHEIIERWYRDELRRVAEPIVRLWETRLGVAVGGVFVQRMKTKWGSCHRETRNIRLNTDLARKPLDCLEYVVLHELIHILEPTHSEAFYGVLDRCLPQWREIRRLLNSLPIRS